MRITHDVPSMHHSRLATEDVQEFASKIKSGPSASRRKKDAVSDNEEESEIEVVPKRKVGARVHFHHTALTTSYRMALLDRSPEHNGFPGRRERVIAPPSPRCSGLLWGFRHCWILRSIISISNHLIRGYRSVFTTSVYSSECSHAILCILGCAGEARGAHSYSKLGRTQVASQVASRHRPKQCTLLLRVVHLRFRDDLDRPPNHGIYIARSEALSTAQTSGTLSHSYSRTFAEPPLLLRRMCVGALLIVRV